MFATIYSTCAHDMVSIVPLVPAKCQGQIVTARRLFFTPFYAKYAKGYLKSIFPSWSDRRCGFADAVPHDDLAVKPEVTELLLLDVEQEVQHHVR